MRWITYLLVFFAVQSTFAQSSWKELTSAELVLETTAVPKNDPFEIGFLIHMKKGWHTYWKNSGDSGAGPRFEWSEKGLSEPLFPTPQVFNDSGIVTFGFEDRVLLVFRHPGIAASTNFKVDAEWLVCKEVCLPAMTQLEFEVKVAPVENIEPSKQRKFFEEARRGWPHPLRAKLAQDGQTVHYSVELKNEPKSFSYFPYQTVPYEKLLPLSHSYQNGVFNWTMPLKKKVSDLSSLEGVVAFDFGSYLQSYEVEAEGGGKIALASLSLLWILLSAFFGGLILNLMPCVFPILSLKLFSVLKTSGHDSHKAKMDNLSYVAGVLVAFSLLGLLLSLVRHAGIQVGWGFQLQSPLFVGSLIILFVILALEMFGFFSFDLLDPSKGSALTRKEGFWGSFFTGVLAVVVASPCSAPFMGAAVGAALTQQGILGMLTFFTLGLGLSFPYLVLAFSPQLLRWVPKPGAWMKTVKELMAFPMLLTALWLLWVYSHITPFENIVVLGVILIGFVFAIWMSGFHRLLAWVLALAVAGAWVAHFVFTDTSMKPSLKSALADSHWISYSEEVLSSRKQGEVIFVNMTADWCITCKVNERLVFETDAVVQTFKDLGIVQVKGDWTQRDPEITSFLDRFNRAGVPFYVIFSDKAPRGEVLSEVLTPASFIQKLKSHSS